MIIMIKAGLWRVFKKQTNLRKHRIKVSWISAIRAGLAYMARRPPFFSLSRDFAR